MVVVSFRSTEFTFSAEVLVEGELASEAIGYFDGNKAAIYKLVTNPSYRRRGFANRLLHEIRKKTGRRVYPLQVIDSPEAVGFWVDWYMEQESVDEARARRMAIEEFQVRSPWEVT